MTQETTSLLKKHLPENIHSPNEVSPPQKNIDLPKDDLTPENIGANLLGKQFAPTTHTLLL